MNLKCPVTDPFFLPLEQVDKGAIRFVLSGANIMCPGLTSPGAKMTPVPKGTVVVSFVNLKFVPNTSKSLPFFTFSRVFLC